MPKARLSSRVGAWWRFSPLFAQKEMLRGAHNRSKCYLLLMVAFAFLSVACLPRKRGVVDSTSTRQQIVSLVDTLRTDTLHFGKVRAGEVVERTFSLSNLSEAPVLIVATDTSCGCLEMEYPREPISAGDKVSAKMTFYSSGYNYFPPRAFYIITSASHTPKKMVVTADME